MSDTPGSRAVTAIYDAVIDEKHRSDALKLVADCVGAAGASYVLVDKYSDRTHLAVSPHAFEGRLGDYHNHFYAIDPYRMARQRGSDGSWVRVSEMFTERFLARDEWYNDFILAGGVRDILGGKLHESPSHIFLIGLLRGVGQSDEFPPDPAALAALCDPLAKAARLHAGLLEAGLRTALDQEAAGQLTTGVVFVDDNSRIIKLNQAAENFLRRGDGLVADGPRLSSRRLGDAAKLAGMISAATARPPGAGCLLLHRAGGEGDYIVRVAPVGIALERFDQPMAMVSITSPAEAFPSADDVAALYGLSPAETRLALALARGDRPAEIAAATGVQITTVRSQLSAVLRKMHAERQSDIVRLLANVPPRAHLRDDDASGAPGG